MVKNLIVMQEIIGLNNRFRIYINYGVIGFILTLIFGILTQGLVIPISGFIFNRVLCSKFGSNKRAIIISMIAWTITSILFCIQYEYRRIIDWSCLMRMSEITVNLSFSFTLILFSILIWEIGLSFRSKKNKGIDC